MQDHKKGSVYLQALALRRSGAAHKYILPFFASKRKGCLKKDSLTIYQRIEKYPLNFSFFLFAIAAVISNNNQVSFLVVVNLQHIAVIDLPF